MIRLIYYSVLVFFLTSGCSSIDEPQSAQNSHNSSDSSSGMITHINNFKSVNIPARDVSVWLPSSYSTKIKYAVLYMHDGQMLFDSTSTWNKQEWKVDETMTLLMKRAEMRKCIVVGVANAEELRQAEYFPQKVYEMLPKAFRDSIIASTKEGDVILADSLRSDRYLKFLVEELKPYIDSNYSTLTDRDNTYIAGSSMGGLISLYAICEYPNVFGGAVCMSTHWLGLHTRGNTVPDALFSYMSSSLPDPLVHKIYFDFGTETLDSLYEPFQTKADSIMRKRGYTSENWTTSKFTGADHSERAWSDRFSIPVRFLLELP